MNKNKYLIRLDDACPTMNHILWHRMEAILDKYAIKPLVGVIPHNEDPQQRIDIEDNGFWNLLAEWQTKGWTMALHGYNHCYNSEGGLQGLNPMWQRSEFAGLPLIQQCEKIRMGYFILKGHGIEPKYFFAPSHTFDENTLTALRKESDIRIICDTIGRWPYKMGDFWFIPQITGHCVDMPLSGIYTFCFHPNTMGDNDFLSLESFLKDNSSSFIAFKDIKLDAYQDKLFIDKLLSFLFFKYRKIKGLR